MAPFCFIKFKNHIGFFVWQNWNNAPFRGEYKYMTVVSLRSDTQFFYFVSLFFEWNIGERYIHVCVAGEEEEEEEEGGGGV